MSSAYHNWVVLLVDDHFDNVMVAQTTLEYYGIQVEVAENGEKALACLEFNIPDVILLDLSMPVLNGWEVLKYLKNVPRLATIPVIAVTAHAMDGDRERALSAGFDDYIAKPYDIRHLVGYIENVIARKTDKGETYA